MTAMTHDDISDAEIGAVHRAALALPFPIHVGPNTLRSLILASRAALLAEGRKVVAREPENQMTDAGGDTLLGNYPMAETVWRAMWDAAP